MPSTTLMYSFTYLMAVEWDLNQSKHLTTWDPSLISSTRLSKRPIQCAWCHLTPGMRCLIISQEWDSTSLSGSQWLHFVKLCMEKKSKNKPEMFEVTFSKLGFLCQKSRRLFDNMIISHSIRYRIRFLNILNV